MIILSIASIVVIIAVVMFIPASGCTGDCNQGRNCTCWRKK